MQNYFSEDNKRVCNLSIISNFEVYRGAGAAAGQGCVFDSQTRKRNV